DRTKDNQPQTQRVGTSGYKSWGSRGLCPRPSFAPFLGRNGDPRRAGGAPGALRLEVASEAPTHRVRSPPSPKAGRDPAYHKRTAGNPAVLSLPMGLSEAA